MKDFNKATVIWNKRTLLYEDKIAVLNELAEKTLDIIRLKRQIKERVNYEEMILARFKERGDNTTVYAVKDCKEECIYGLFAKFTTALLQAKKVGNEEEMDMMIEKHEIVTGDTIPIKNIGRLNPNLFPEVPEMLVEYRGMPIASMYLNEKGELMSFWSEEIPEEEKKMDSYDIKRFEFQFFHVPYIHRKGLPVKNAASAFADKKAWALMRALEAMSAYMSGYTQEDQVQIVLRTTREYAEACKEMTEFEKQEMKAKTVEEILT